MRSSVAITRARTVRHAIRERSPGYSPMSATIREHERAEEVPPDPAAMIESMRAFGYSPAAAIADLVDNSVTAGATVVDIHFEWEGERSWVAVIDDGAGMDRERLRQAMRLGSRSPREVRAPSDLGRFGLGLKTAGFSLGRSLTVASRIAGDDINLR